MAGTLDAPTLRRAMELYLAVLREHRDEINSLNVYPVPDGDTGTNLLLTQQAVVEALPPEEAGTAALGDAISQSSLMGARGNSGVILSQVLRGLIEGLTAEPSVTDLVEGLRRAADDAWRAVANPAEGTVLTVLRDSAEAAARAAATTGGADAPTRTAAPTDGPDAAIGTAAPTDGPDAAIGATDPPGQPSDQGPLDILRVALDESRASLERTRQIHPDLAAAGVVDAGGKGIVLLLESLRAAVAGEVVTEPVGRFGPVGRGEPADLGAFAFAYEVQFLMGADEAALASLRRSLSGVGDSLVIVGGGDLFSVHVHSNRPGVVLERALETGEPKRVAITYLPDHGPSGRSNGRSCPAGEARGVRLQEQECGLVAVADGAGVIRTFRSLGAVVVVGGAGHNPSVADLVRAIEATPAGSVVVLPNHENVIPAAERATEASSREAWVVPTDSIPAGLAAATAFNPMASAGWNVEAIAEAASACRAAAMARADRDAETPVGPVRAGQWLGISSGQAVSVGDEAGAAVMVAVRTLLGDAAELLTLVVGEGVDEADRAAVARTLAEGFPWLRLEIIEGGQPLYPFLIGVE